MVDFTLVNVRVPTLIIDGSFARDSRILADDLTKMGFLIRSFKEPLTRSVKQVMIPSIRRNFDSEGRPAWQPLNENTIRQRSASGYGAGPILQRTRRLMRTATTQAIWKITRTEAYIDGLDSRVAYAKYHQSGTRHMPQRPIIVIQPEDERDIEDVFDEWLEERIGRYVTRRGISR